MSWIVRNKESGAVICEVFDVRKLAHLNTAKYEVVSALRHLCELNEAVKDGDLRYAITDHGRALLEAGK